MFKKKPVPITENNPVDQNLPLLPNPELETIHDSKNEKSKQSKPTEIISNNETSLSKDDEKIKKSKKSKKTKDKADDVLTDPPSQTLPEPEKKHKSKKDNEAKSVDVADVVPQDIPLKKHKSKKDKETKVETIDETPLQQEKVVENTEKKHRKQKIKDSPVDPIKEQLQPEIEPKETEKHPKKEKTKDKKITFETPQDNAKLEPENRLDIPEKKKSKEKDKNALPDIKSPPKSTPVEVKKESKVALPMIVNDAQSLPNQNTKTKDQIKEKNIKEDLQIKSEKSSRDNSAKKSTLAKDEQSLSKIPKAKSKSESNNPNPDHRKKEVESASKEKRKELGSASKEKRKEVESASKEKRKELGSASKEKRKEVGSATKEKRKEVGSATKEKRKEVGSATKMRKQNHDNNETKSKIPTSAKKKSASPNSSPRRPVSSKTGNPKAIINRPVTAKIKKFKITKSQIPIIKRKKKRVVTSYQIVSTVKKLSEFLQENLSNMMTKTNSTDNLDGQDKDGNEGFSNSDLIKNCNALKLTIADLEKQLLKEKDRNLGVVPKVLGGASTSIEANIHLRYQYQKALDQERENYNNLIKENQKIVQQMRALEMKQFKYKKVQSIDEQAVHNNEISSLRNKIKEQELEKTRLIEDHERTRLLLIKERKEKERVLNEITIARSLQMHISDQLAGHWGNLERAKTTTSSNSENESGLRYDTEEPVVKVHRVKENKPSKPKVVRPTIASAGRQSALKAKEQRDLEEKQKLAKKKLYGKSHRFDALKSANKASPETKEDGLGFDYDSEYENISKKYYSEEEDFADEPKEEQEEQEEQEQD